MSLIVDVFGAISKGNVSISQLLSVLNKGKKINLVRVLSFFRGIFFWLSLSLSWVCDSDGESIHETAGCICNPPPAEHRIQRRKHPFTTAGFINGEIGGIWGLIVSDFWVEIEEISKQEASSFFSRYDSRFIMCRFVYLICWI